MAITKTDFINYIRCPRFCALDRVHEKKLDYLETLEEYRAQEEEEIVMDLLGDMYAEDENGNEEDLLVVKNEQLEVMMPYYKQIEILTGNYLDQKIGKSIYSSDTLFQESFDALINGIRYLCYVDIYTETSDTITITEVKATTAKKFLALGTKECSIFVKGNDNIYYLQEEFGDIAIDEKKYGQYRKKLFDKYGPCGHYVYDLAVQRYIIEHDQNEHPSNKKMKYYLAVLNSDYVFDGTYEDDEPKYELDKIISLFDMTKITEEYMELIDLDRSRVENYVLEKDLSPYPLGSYCEYKKTTKCKFAKICFDKLPKYNSILCYLGNHNGFKTPNDEKYTTYELINQGMYHMQDVPIEYLNRKTNQIQREVLDTEITYVDKDKIIDGIKEIRYPIYHLDFETFPGPLPRYKGEKCYNQSVFQFSLHVEKEPFCCDKEKDHYEFLARDDKDHRLELVQKLCEYIKDDNGTILVYNESFEKTRLKELGIIFPEYQQKLEAMRERIFDLLHLVKTNSKLYQDLGYDEERSKMFNYYHKNLYGSFSIKKVLPLFTNLTYEGMEVANGTDAIVTYARFPKMDQKMYEHKYNKLLEYCKQDTWAMVEVLWGLKKSVE